MVKKETKEFIFRVAFYTLMITSLIIFCVFLYQKREERI